MHGETMKFLMALFMKTAVFGFVRPCTVVVSLKYGGSRFVHNVSTCQTTRQYISEDSSHFLYVIIFNITFDTTLYNVTA